MPLTINVQKLWDQKYLDESVPFPVDGTIDSGSSTVTGVPTVTNVKDYGAKVDGYEKQNGSITASSTTLNGTFQESGTTDTGKLIMVQGAGASTSGTLTSQLSSGHNLLTDTSASFSSADVGKMVTGTGIPSRTFVWGVVDSHNIRLTANASSTMNVGASYTVTGHLYTTIVSTTATTATLADAASTTVSANGWYYYGSDDTAAIQAAYNSLPTSGHGSNFGGTIYHPPGWSMVSATITIPAQATRIMGGGAQGYSVKLAKGASKISPIRRHNGSAFEVFKYTGGGNNNGPTIQDLHVTGLWSDSLGGIHIIQSNNWRLDRVTCSDFPQGYGVNSDGTGGFSQLITFNSVNLNSCKTGLVSFQTIELIVNGGIMDGRENVVSISPTGTGTIAIDASAGGTVRIYGVYIQSWDTCISISTPSASIGTGGGLYNVQLENYQTALISSVKGFDVIGGTFSEGAQGGTATGIQINAGATRHFLKPGYYGSIPPSRIYVIDPSVTDTTILDPQNWVIPHQAVTADIADSAVTPAKTATAIRERTIMLTQAGALSTAADCSDYFIAMPHDMTLARMRCVAKSAPTGAMTVQLRRSTATTTPSWSDVTGFQATFSSGNAEALVDPGDPIAYANTLGTNTNTSGTNTVTLTTSNSAPSNSLIVLRIGWATGATLSSVSGGALTWNIDTQTQNTNGPTSIAIVSAYAASGLASSTTITATFSTTTGSKSISADAWTGTATTSIVDQSTTHGSSSSGPAVSSGSITTTVSSSLVIATFCAGQLENSFSQSGWTALPDDPLQVSNGSSLFSFYRIVSTAATYSLTGNMDINANYAAAILNYKQGAIDVNEGDLFGFSLGTASGSNLAVEVIGRVR